MPCLRERLRERTRDVHERLERRLPLMSADLTVAEYRCILLGLHGFHRPLEDAFERAGAWARLGFDTARRGRVARLEADLIHLGMTREALASAPRCDVGPLVVDDARRLGCIYVVEGATLGGQIIGRHLRERLGVLPEAGGGFFFGHGEATGAMWREVLQRLEAFEARGEDSDASVEEGALAAFGTLERWLGERGVLR